MLATKPFLNSNGCCMASSLIIAIVLQALWKLGKKAAKDLPTTIAGVGSGGLLRWIERNFAAGVARELG